MSKSLLAEGPFNRFKSGKYGEREDIVDMMEALAKTAKHSDAGEAAAVLTWLNDEDTVDDDQFVPQIVLRVRTLSNLGI